MSAETRPRTRRSRVLAAVRLDLEHAGRSMFVDSVLGSALVPRPARWLGYRALGVRTQTSNIFPGVVIAGPPHNLTLGPGTFVNRGVYFEAVAPISIGANCKLGPQVMVVTSHHDVTGSGVARVRSGLPVTIGDRVWMGARVTVLPGVRIAADVVVAAGAVVASDCDRPGLWGGVPARFLHPPGQP